MGLEDVVLLLKALQVVSKVAVTSREEGWASLLASKPSVVVLQEVRVPSLAPFLCCSLGCMFSCTRHCNTHLSMPTPQLVACRTCVALTLTAPTLSQQLSPTEKRETTEACHKAGVKIIFI
jgi:hypothetical protein